MLELDFSDDSASPSNAMSPLSEIALLEPFTLSTYPEDHSLVFYSLKNTQLICMSRIQPILGSPTTVDRYVSDPDTIEDYRKIVERSMEEWVLTEISNSEKLYLLHGRKEPRKGKAPVQHRDALVSIVLSTHKLAVEQLRWTTPTTEREWRTSRPPNMYYFVASETKTVTTNWGQMKRRRWCYRCTDLNEGLQMAVLEAFNWTLGSIQQLKVDRELGLWFGWGYQWIINQHAKLDGRVKITIDSSESEKNKKQNSFAATWAGEFFVGILEIFNGHSTAVRHGKAFTTKLGWASAVQYVWLEREGEQSIGQCVIDNLDNMENYEHKWC
ncbi:uncharacterized protein EV420DRAFT_1485870 [Desarmillaria tabescens]|uniref:Uncharacterized protein n=1 Tax=Armillaria tabescens TaxID=1929756 RepID=A0AA39JDA3_ARMTA|nr:uncharacterized protein EV420DRAFT_1485870 [Desarmillaria tabescens]KAK0440661.1 hypothetical protein EV420DRAFT_1485870 [Desarmillaria tabescens]